MNGWHDFLTAWQDWAALALVALAVGFVAWRAWRSIAARRVTGCGSGCGKCVGEKPAVLQIDADAKR
jgi:hypothetical protein